MTEIIYWDSDAFLGWLQEEAGKVELCQGTLEHVTDPDFQFSSVRFGPVALHAARAALQLHGEG
jgi:hypothetical protein